MNASFPAYWPAARKHLSAADPVMGKLIRAYKGEGLRGRGDAYVTLARAIAGQQISVKAADAVWNRLLAGFGGNPAPARMLATTEEELRTYGFSRQKIAYLHDLSRYFHEGHAAAEQWESMEDEALIASLTSIKGIGRWTAEMFLIFHLQRPDVFPLADIGLQKAVEKHYFSGRKLSAETLRTHGEAWQPYRSVATWYLWRSLDPIPVEY